MIFLPGDRVRDRTYSGHDFGTVYKVSFELVLPYQVQFADGCNDSCAVDELWSYRELPVDTGEPPPLEQWEAELLLAPLPL